MFAGAQTLDEFSEPLPTEEQQDAAFFRDVLLDITDAAREFAKLLLVTAQCAVQQGAPPEEIRSLAAAFDRTSRGARRAILLARHLKRPLRPARQPGDAPQAKSPRAAPSVDRPERQADLRERLDAIDAVLALAPEHRPAAIAALKRDLARIYDELSEPRAPQALHGPATSLPGPVPDH